MRGQNVVSRVRAARGSTRYLVHGCTLLVVYTLGLAAVFLTPQGSAVAAWWPAAGVSVVAVLFARGPAWRIALAIAVVTAASNYVAGRPLELAVLFGVANACEAWLVAVLVTRLGRSARLERMSDVGHLLLSTLAGATVIGILAGATVAMTSEREFLPIAAAIGASHASAVLVIVPLVLVRASSWRVGSLLERVLHAAVLLLVLAIVFAPGQSWPVGFLSFPVLAWAAFRFGVAFVAAELLATAGIVTVLTAVGGGPFVGAAVESTATGSALLQVYLLAQTSSILFLAGARHEREHLAVEVAARERLLRGGFVGAQVGFVILEQGDADTVRVIEANSVAARLLDWPELPASATEGRIVPLRRDPFLDVVARVLAGPVDEATDDIVVGGGRRVEVFATRFAGQDGNAVVTAQLIDVTARRQAEGATLAALRHERDVAERLRDLAVQKDDFVSSVSHELRTPITSILGFAEELEETSTGEDRDHLRIIVRNARRLATLVEDLLESGSMTTHNPMRPDAAIGINDIVRECIEDQQGSARSRGQLLSVDVDPTAPQVRGDANDLARILLNLLTNAIKFTPEGGIVRVATVRAGALVELVVSDSGPGIPDGDLEHVFERFYRSPEARERGVPGTGLGLSIVHSLVERLGGRVRLSAVDPHGTRVTVALPAIDRP